MHIAGWTIKASDTDSEYVTIIVFHCISGCTNVAQCYAVCALMLDRQTRAYNVTPRRARAAALVVEKQ